MFYEHALMAFFSNGGFTPFFEQPASYPSRR
jgi:hypothetical protein